MKFFLPVKTISEANTRSHWSKLHKLHKMQRACVQMYIDFKKIKLPCTVKLIRQSPRKLDTDNLPVSMKYIRDAIADHLIPGLAPGRADDDQRLNWQYEQTTAKKSDNPIKYGVWVEFILN